MIKKIKRRIIKDINTLNIILRLVEEPKRVYQLIMDIFILQFIIVNIIKLM